jgi:hypothetical protein
MLNRPKVQTLKMRLAAMGRYVIAVSPNIVLVAFDPIAKSI